jgi:hypothetical protein
MRSPACWMVSSPSMIVPQLMSIMSGILSAVAVLVDSLITGVTGFPVGVPNPVVNKTMVAPEPTSAVVLYTSLPGVQSRFKPGFVTFCG